MPVTRADEVDARPSDNAKELLALRDWMREPDHAAEFRLPGLLEWIDRRPVALVDRLSARQQASVEEVARSIAFQEWPLARTDERAKWVETHWQRYAPTAHTLLAKYDIFDKVEG